MWNLFGKFVVYTIIMFGATLTLGMGIGAGQEYLDKRNTPTPTPTQPVTPSPTTSPSPTLTQKKQPSPINSNTSTDSKMWEVTSDGKTSWSKLPADDHMSTSEELNSALNSYRQAHNLPQFARNDVLCEIALKRANELKELGQLDSHAGFEKYARGQQTYDTMDEIIQGGVIPLSGVHLIEWGWDRSVTGHRDTLQSRELTDGCAAVSGLFAVAIFGAR